VPLYCSAKEVAVAVTKAAADARKCVIDVPLAKGQSVPHRVTVKGSGGAVVMLRPAGPGTGGAVYKLNTVVIHSARKRLVSTLDTIKCLCEIINLAEGK
jgi:ribosomal protein S5